MRFDELMAYEDFGIHQDVVQVEFVQLEIQPVAVVTVEVQQQNYFYSNESGEHYSVLPQNNNQEQFYNYDYGGGGDGASGSGGAGAGAGSAGGTGCGGNGSACGSDGSA